MKLINKIRTLICDSSGESIVEVMVAFTLLSIMMLLFSQGLASATNSEMNAKQNRDSADNTMITLQKKLISDDSTINTGAIDGVDVTVSGPSELNNNAGISINSYTYTVNGNTYIVYMPDAT